jgi:hypothetical protein
MFKLLFTGVLLYLAYRLLISPPRIDPPRYPEDDRNSGNRKRRDDDYVDYEELD